jgi:nitroreductase
MGAVVNCNRGKFKPHGRGLSAAQPYVRRKANKIEPMIDALELLTTRRSVKALELAGPGPSAAEIETLLTVASRVPDHGKLVPWRFIIFEGTARRAAGDAIAAAFRKKYPQATAEQAEAERKRLARAPLVIAVVSRAGPHVKIPEWEQVLSAGAAAMSLVLAAHALGYAANWITEWYAYDRGVLDALGLKENERIAGFVHIGRAGAPAEDRPRPPLAEIATRFDANGGGGPATKEQSNR